MCVKAKLLTKVEALFKLVWDCSWLVLSALLSGKTGCRQQKAAR